MRSNKGFHSGSKKETETNISIRATRHVLHPFTFSAVILHN